MRYSLRPAPKSAMDLGDLKHWLPIGLNITPPVPSIDWCDLSGVALSEPFFRQTLARWTQGPDARRLLRTDLQALADLDALAPGLEPAGFIFHMARCGSTLVSRALSTLPGMIVASEPDPINDLLEADPELLHDAALVEVLRLLVRALGRPRLGDERRYIVKLSSWNIRRFDLFRRAFPLVPWVWVYRRPAEVIASILAAPPGWMELRHHPRRAEYLLGIDPGNLAGISPPAFCARVLARFCEAALAADDGSAALVDYCELPDAIWTRIAPHFGIALSPAEIAAMRVETGFYAKDPVKRAFNRDDEAKRGIAPEIIDLADHWLGPLFAEMETRRLVAIDSGR